LNEATLIEELKNKSERALDEIIEKFQNNVYNTCLGLVQNSEDAEEITQDVFVKVYNNCSSFKGDSSFSTWLYRIAINESLQYLRKKNAKKSIQWLTGFFGKKENENSVITFEHPGILIEKKEDAKSLFKAINTLPEKQKVAFNLKNIEMLSTKEVAEIMETTENAIESLLQRAKQNLKTQLKKQ
jgi:RNA polymerase sigma factor (sigma-70 family)